MPTKILIFFTAYLFYSTLYFSRFQTDHVVLLVKEPYEYKHLFFNFLMCKLQAL